MFELKIALKYLLPRKKSLTSSLVSIMSVLVISLVVWLVLVFLSVTSGIEKSWIKKLTNLHSPIRISPSKYYFDSYYYLVDAISQRSNFSYKNISQKLTAERSDPYDPISDAEIPPYIPNPDLDSKGKIIDPVKDLFSLLNKTKASLSINFQEYEIAAALMKLSIRSGTSTLSQMSFLSSIPEQNPDFTEILLPNVQESLPDAQTAFFQNGQFILPQFSDHIPAILPKAYRDHGANIGDFGTLSYQGFAATAATEQKIHFRVVGFYDPGIMAVGNKCLLIPKSTIEEINLQTSSFSPDGTPTNGICVWVNNLEEVPKIAQNLKDSLKKQNLDKFWTVSTYEEYEFAKDLLNQFKSDKILLLLIGVIILIVACSNIITLLVLLVHDKKTEIAILQAMGASSRSLAGIFGFCGAFMGTIGGLLGAVLAQFTLYNLDFIANVLSTIQGRSAFNPLFFGKSLPKELSQEAFLFVMVATCAISLIAGLVPAIKACKIPTSEALKSR